MRISHLRSYTKRVRSNYEERRIESLSVLRSGLFRHRSEWQAGRGLGMRRNTVGGQEGTTNAGPTHSPSAHLASGGGP